MKVMELRCPNCGALVSPQTVKCQYCGAYLVLQDNVPILKNKIPCPQCGSSIGSGSFICIDCGKILTTDPKELEIIKTLQKRERFMQDRLRNLLFNRVREWLQLDEYIYHISGAKGGFLRGKDRQTVVTDKRIVRYFDGTFNDILYENIVTISACIPLTHTSFDLYAPDGTNVTILGYSVMITTYGGDISFLFSDVPSAQDFSTKASLAWNNNSLKRKDIMVLLCFTNV